MKSSNQIYVNSNKSEFRPMAANSSTINKPSSSIAELVMKGEIDHSLARVTTGRPTIVIYPTGNFPSITIKEMDQICVLLFSFLYLSNLLSFL